MLTEDGQSTARYSRNGMDRAAYRFYRVRPRKGSPNTYVGGERNHHCDACDGRPSLQVLNTLIVEIVGKYDDDDDDDTRKCNKNKDETKFVGNRG